MLQLKQINGKCKEKSNQKISVAFFLNSYLNGAKIVYSWYIKSTCLFIYQFDIKYLLGLSVDQFFLNVTGLSSSNLLQKPPPLKTPP